jgi:hypothetical protein
MLSEPLLAHPAEIGGIHPTERPHPGNADHHDERRDEADDIQQWLLQRRVSAPKNNHDTRQGKCLCTYAQDA